MHIYIYFIIIYNVACTIYRKTNVNYCSYFSGKWCQRRDWPPPLDARAASAAEAAKRGLLYQSVFLGGSPNDYNSCKYI